MIENLITLYNQATEWEKQRGYRYYDWQRTNLELRAKKFMFPLETVVGAFCALSPNNSEKITYRDLDLCIRISLGNKPEEKVASFTPNKEKAFACYLVKLWQMCYVGRRWYRFSIIRWIQMIVRM
jgi:hypothetical protein